MANLTRNQIKARVKKLVEILEDVRCELEMLQSDTQEECDNIEPYEGKDELTEQQEERADYLQETADNLETQADNLADIISELEDLTY